MWVPGRINTFESAVEVINNTKNLRVVHSYDLQRIEDIVSKFGLTQLYQEAFGWFDGDFALSDYILARNRYA
jgi:hypothetical protein